MAAPIAYTPPPFVRCRHAARQIRVRSSTRRVRFSREAPFARPQDADVFRRTAGSYQSGDRRGSTSASTSISLASCSGARHLRKTLSRSFACSSSSSIGHRTLRSWMFEACPSRLRHPSKARQLLHSSLREALERSSSDRPSSKATILQGSRLRLSCDGTENLRGDAVQRSRGRARKPRCRRREGLASAIPNELARSLLDT